MKNINYLKLLMVLVAGSGYIAAADIKEQIEQADTQLKNAQTKMTAGKALLQNNVVAGLTRGIQQIDQTLQGVKATKKQVLDIIQAARSIPDAGIALRSIAFRVIQIGDLEDVINLLAAILDKMEKNLESIKANFTAALNGINDPKINIFTKFTTAQDKLSKATGKLDAIIKQWNEEEE